MSSAVSLSLFGLASELSTDPKLSVRMRSMTARVVGSCDILAVVATSATGVYGAPKRARRTLHVLRLLTSVSPRIMDSTTTILECPLTLILLEKPCQCLTDTAVLHPTMGFFLLHKNNVLKWLRSLAIRI